MLCDSTGQVSDRMRCRGREVTSWSSPHPIREWFTFIEKKCKAFCESTARTWTAVTTPVILQYNSPTGMEYILYIYMGPYLELSFICEIHTSEGDVKCTVNPDTVCTVYSLLTKIGSDWSVVFIFDVVLIKQHTNKLVSPLSLMGLMVLFPPTTPNGDSILFGFPANGMQIILEDLTSSGLDLY